MGSRWRGGWRRWPWQATIEGHARLLCDRRQLPSGLAILDSVSFRRIQALRLCTDTSEQPANIRVTQRRSALPAVVSNFFSVSPTHPGSEGLTNGRSISGVCASGYHMASIWEFRDLSKLEYATSHAEAYIAADQGAGPPVQRTGWMRSNRESNGSGGSGEGNCWTWTNASSSGYGATLYFVVTSPGDLTTVVYRDNCNLAKHVWCAQD